MTILRDIKGINTLVDNTGDALSKLYGLDGNDKLYGGRQTDYLYGGVGNDSLYGGVGDDWLWGERGGDRLDGGAGYDGASYYDSTGVFASLDKSIAGTGEAAGDSFVSIEMLEGSNTGADKLAGNSIDNWLWGLGGNDRLYGRAGHDTLDGGAGKDVLYGEAGNDWLSGGAGGDLLYGGVGIDTVDYSRGLRVNVSLDGSIAGTGDALGDRFSSIEKVVGANNSGSRDKISGNSSANFLLGLGGDDYLYGRGGNDWLVGGQGADVLSGGTGIDGANYGDSNGVHVSLDRSLTAEGEAVGDVLVSIENLEGSLNGSDYLVGNSLANSIFGNGGADNLFGRSGDDFISGGDDGDELEGQAGNDFLVGGEGYDRVSGGTGDDQFGFERPSHGVDEIGDFATGDKLVFEKANFGNLPLGTLASGRFQNGTGHAATTTSIRFMYDTDTRSLWYDSDGSGSKSAVEIAKVSSLTPLIASDLEIITL